MKIILIRHFKVDYKWNLVYNSNDYEKACENYDNSKVIQANLEFNHKGVIISSTMLRAIETSNLIFNKPPDICSELLREVPIKPFVKTNLALPTFIWHLIGRIQWRINYKKQPETYIESQFRVNTFLDKFMAKNEDIVIVAHGWIIKLIIKKLRRDNFHGKNPTFIKNGFPYEFST